MNVMVVCPQLYTTLSKKAINDQIYIYKHISEYYRSINSRLLYSSVIGKINFGSPKGEHIYDAGVTIVIMRRCSDKAKIDKEYSN